MKSLFVVMLIAVLGALAGAGLFMLRKSDDSEDQRSSRMAKALALRVGLSVALFAFILLSWAMGWIKPGGLPVLP